MYVTSKNPVQNYVAYLYQYLYNTRTEPVQEQYSTSIEPLQSQYKAITEPGYKQ